MLCPLARRCVLVAVIMLSGCASVDTAAVTSSEVQTSPGPVTTWQEPDSYAFLLEVSGGLFPLNGRFQVTVRNGAVTQVEGLDQTGLAYLQHGTDGVPTIRDLLDQAEEARLRGAEVVQVTTAPQDGHPTSITLDDSLQATDD